MIGIRVGVIGKESGGGVLWIFGDCGIFYEFYIYSMIIGVFILTFLSKRNINVVCVCVF